MDAHKAGAAAILGLGLTCAQAMAQQGIVIYGVLDLGLVADRNAGASALRLESGGHAGPRLGFRGEEDLGGGMSASFALEAQIDVDTGASAFADRAFGSQSWVGLSGPWGGIKAGRMFTPYFGAIATNDPFGAKGPGDATRLFADSGVRMDNTVKYSLPPLNGWYGDLAYAAGESAAGRGALRQVSMDVGYAAGPLNVQLALHDSNDAAGARLARSTLIGGNYDFGPVRAWLVAARSRNDGALDTRDLLLGASMPLGPHTLAAGYVRKADHARANAGASQVAAGYYYYLSRRSNLYLVYSRLRNDSLASYQAMLPGGTRRLATVGMRHVF
ncbi:porin [Pseudoduganella namucuonensis]|uniref:Outer membrane protein (Porin) n=1 Tax=Pseudoduganella namucuonensis TaxID=1035707 RepID=A0A1I7EVU4_9BURK|nr:porin [Pseudoduganella namucuonensis]SFU28043.1 Outer membrane protein (porin) [Pseudoduganella namucuonensis]